MVKKRTKWKVGDIFVVPQTDGESSIGQIVGQEPDALNSVICAFYDFRLQPNREMPNALPAERVISILFVTRDLLDSGDWSIIGHTEPANLRLISASLEDSKQKKFVGVKIIGSGNVIRFLNAYFGLAPWDDWSDPNYLDGFLISPDKKPNNLVLVKSKQQYSKL